jgi:hypothetical protein
MKRENLFRDPKVIVLAALILAVIIINVRQWGPAGGAIPIAQDKMARHNKRVVDPEPILLFNQLQSNRINFEQEKRNIFAFTQPDAPTPSEEETGVAESTPPPAVCGNNICEPGEDPTNCPTDCQPPPPPPPVINLRYIGYLSEPQGAVAFLTDGKEVYMARINDVVANQYRVLNITEDQIELGLLSNNQSSTIRFQGNQGG